MIRTLKKFKKSRFDIINETKCKILNIIRNLVYAELDQGRCCLQIVGLHAKIVN